MKYLVEISLNVPKRLSEAQITYAKTDLVETHNFLIHQKFIKIALLTKMGFKYINEKGKLC